MELRRWRGPSIALALSFLTPCFAMQAGSPDNIFTIAVAAPTSAKEVQVRYLFSDELGSHQSSVANSTDDNKIAIKTGAPEKTAQGFKAIVYAPGCQFVTISVDDPAAGARQGEFQCQKLPATELKGRINVSAFRGRELKVEVLYQVGWAGQFFGVPGMAISPLYLAKVDVQSDGSFGVEIPDFSVDPLWQSLSKDATLEFFLSDVRGGARLAELQPGDASSANARLKVAPAYPEIDFNIHPQLADMPAAKN